MHFSQPPVTPSLLGSKYAPQHPVLEHLNLLKLKLCHHSMLNVMSYLFTDLYHYSLICCDLKDYINIQVDNKGKGKAVP